MKETNVIIDELIDKLYLFLLECDVKPKDKKLSTLVKSLDSIIAMKKDKTYYGVKFDENKVINNILEVDGIVLNSNDLPLDLLRGYYKYEKGKIVLDEILRTKLWEA